MQLAYVIDERLQDVAEDVDQEKALKDIVVATTKDQKKAAEAAEKKARESEKTQALAEQRLA